jgi:hypothetical protein
MKTLFIIGIPRKEAVALRELSGAGLAVVGTPGVRAAGLVAFFDVFRRFFNQFIGFRLADSGELRQLDGLGVFGHGRFV